MMDSFHHALKLDRKEMSVFLLTDDKDQFIVNGVEKFNGSSQISPSFSTI